MPVAASLFLARTTGKPGELCSTLGTPGLSPRSIQAHTCTTATQLDSPSFSLWIGGMMKFHSLCLHPLETEALCLQGHSAAFVLAPKHTWPCSGVKLVLCSQS